ncbi:MAG: hypothetical protein AAF721_17330 [Myxococcota bacterium]
MVAPIDPDNDPFTVKPPDPEFVAMEAAMKRKGIIFGSIITAFSGLSLLTGVWLFVEGRLQPALTGMVLGLAGILWGVTHISKVKQSDYSE